jgi:hypothetical protein
MSTKPNEPQNVTIGRHVHQLPEVTAADLRKAETKRRDAELATERAALAEQKLENARLADELHQTRIVGLVQARSERYSANDRAKLETAVLFAREAWALAGRKGEFDWVHPYRLAEYELGLVGAPPAPKDSNQLAALSLLATQSPEAAAQATKARHDEAAQVAAAYKKIPGLIQPGSGGGGYPGSFSRPF